MEKALQQLYNESEVNVPKTRKTKGASSHQSMLESLKKGDGVRKTEEDSLLLANTYDPDSDSKRKKSNKQRQQEMESKRQRKAGVVNEGYDKESSPTTTPKKKTVKKSQVPKVEETISDLAPPPRNPTKARKVKKTVQAEPVQEDAQVGSEGEDRDGDAGVKSEASELGATPSKVKKKKRKKKTTDALDAEEAKAVVEDDGRIIGLKIHRTDKLKTDFHIAHPLVRVHVVDLETGNYLKKQNKSRAVTSFYEGRNENVDFVLPILTQPFDFKTNQSTLPVWEELLILNENFNYFIQEEPRVMLMFELLDFVSMNAARQRYSLAKEEGGWHRVAWAFLKVVGATGKPNTDRKVRLQLYEAPVRFHTLGGQLEVFQWWKSAQRIPYPSTLYVTVKGIISPEKVEPTMRSMFATQEETGHQTYDELQRTMEGGTARRQDTGRRAPSKWSRLVGQLCKIPNSLALSLPAGRKGCFVVRFSPDGHHLACGCHDTDGHPILIYEIPSGKLKGRLLGHYSIVYDISWDRSGKQLLSASGDGTARVWDIEKMSSSASKTLPHPSFVYCAKFHIRVDKVVVTGGYDRILRVWTLHGADSQAQLLQELDGHEGHINSLCFEAEGSVMYSADSLGDLRVWNVCTTEKPSSNGVLRDWSFQKSIVEADIKGVPINKIQLHPSGRRLLVHCRDNTLRMLDLRVSAVMQRYVGALNFRDHVHCTFTPCGAFIFAGSEDSCVYVWNSDTGDQVATYTELGFRQPVCDVDYHPLDHVVAFCSFGENHQILVYKYDHNAAARELGIGAGAPKSPVMRPGAELRAEDEGMEASRSKTMNIRDSVQLEESSKINRVMKKLDAVSAFKNTTSANQGLHPLGVPGGTSSLPRGVTGTLGTTWGSEFDTFQSNLQTRTMSPEPSLFSPHASRTLSGAAANQHQLASHMEYMKQSQGSWRPSFTQVGGRSGSPTHFGRQPAISINATQGKPQFSFLGNQSKQARSELVVALYDYQAQRSDELSLARGDMIKVLYKDNDNWWMGELSSGEQGFFPANYASNLSNDNPAEEDPTLAEYRVRVEQENEEEDEEEEEDGEGQAEKKQRKGRRSRTAAVVSKSGELKFLSGTEDSDAESSTHRPRRVRQSRKKLSLEGGEGPSTSKSTSGRRRRSENESIA